MDCPWRRHLDGYQLERPQEGAEHGAVQAEAGENLHIIVHSNECLRFGLRVLAPRSTHPGFPLLSRISNFDSEMRTEKCAIPSMLTLEGIDPCQVGALPAELVEEDGGEGREEEGADAGAADGDAGGQRAAPLEVVSHGHHGRQVDQAQPEPADHAVGLRARRCSKRLTNLQV